MKKFLLNSIIIFLFLKIEEGNNSYLNNFILRMAKNRNFRNLEISKLNSNPIACNIKNCQKCEKSNECSICKNNYKLINNHCYNTECQIFGFCSYCDEFDCIECMEGYQLNFGTCDKTKNGFKKKLILGILIPTVIIAIFIYLYIQIRNKNKKIIETGKVINLKHPKTGNYIILPETLREDQNNSDSFSKCSNLTQNYETNEDVDSKVCIVCGKKKFYALADCGCGLCKEHWKFIKNPNNEKISCRVHGSFLKSITFSLDNKTNIKGNAVEKLGLKICPVCKINNGTQSFNCECNMKVCEKCFNDNVYILKYNQCPGCGMPYNPNKDNKSGFKFGKKRIKQEQIEENEDKDTTKSSS